MCWSFRKKVNLRGRYKRKYVCPDSTELLTEQGEPLGCVVIAVVSIVLYVLTCSAIAEKLRHRPAKKKDRASCSLSRAPRSAT